MFQVSRFGLEQDETTVRRQLLTKIDNGLHRIIPSDDLVRHWRRLLFPLTPGNHMHCRSGPFPGGGDSLRDSTWLGSW
jgi:hypothetical protein